MPSLLRGRPKADVQREGETEQVLESQILSVPWLLESVEFNTMADSDFCGSQRTM